MFSLSPLDQGNFWSKSNINLESSVCGGECQRRNSNGGIQLPLKALVPLPYGKLYIQDYNCVTHSLCAENHYVDSRSHIGFHARPGSAESLKDFSLKHAWPTQCVCQTQ